jgi:hypothetical protein
LIVDNLDELSRRILEELRNHPNGINLNSLHRKIGSGKEKFGKSLHALEKYGAVVVREEGSYDIYTLVPEIASRFLEKNIVLIPDETDGEVNRTIDLTPRWFKDKRHIMEKIESALSSNGSEIGSQKQRFDQFKLDLEKDICDNSLMVTSELCSSAHGMWSLVGNEILERHGDDSDILKFLLCEVRAALLLETYSFIQKERKENGAGGDWLETVVGFLNRWNRISTTLNVGGSWESDLPSQVFDDFILRENPDTSAGEKYIRLTYDVIKWHALTRGISGSRFDIQYQRSEDTYYSEAVPLLNKTRQIKKYRLGRHRGQ